MRTFIIAEIGNNHEGSFSLAKKLIYKAYLAKVDAVKFQIFDTENYVSKINLKRFNRLKKFQLSLNEFLKLRNYAKSLKLKFIATPLDQKSLNFLIKNSEIIKISSGDNNNFDLILPVLEKKKTCIISTGFLSEQEIKKLVNFLVKRFGKKFISKHLKILYCVSSYPPKINEMNVSSIKRLKKLFNLEIGFSDHSIGIESCNLAVAYGATIIEKHFTLNKNFSSFHDHKISSDPIELKKLVSSIRKIELLKGNPIKKIQKGEKNILNLSRRSFYAKNLIKKKQIIKIDDLISLRPFQKNSITFSNLNKIINKPAKQNYSKGDVIKV